MSLVKRLNTIAPLFEKGGKYERWFPVFEIVDTFLYSPASVTSGKTHVRDGLDLKRLMTVVVVALIPAMIMAIYNAGFQANAGIVANGIEPIGWRYGLMSLIGMSNDPNSLISNIFLGSLFFLPMYVMTQVVGGFWELLFAVVRKHEIGEGFFVTGFLFPLIVPPDLPLWQGAVALSIGLVVGKEVFGGTGMNIVNPAIIARAVLFFSYPASVTGDTMWVGVDGLSQATPMGQVASNGMSGMTYSFMDAVLGFIPGSMGETSVIACLIGAVILIISGIGSWRIMLSCVIGLLIVTGIFYGVGSDTNHMFGLSPLWHLVLGGFAFGTVFMATDPVSAAMTNTGRWYYGFLIGAMTGLVRVVNPAYPEGMMLAILFANVFAPVIDHYVVAANIRRRQKRYV